MTKVSVNERLIQHRAGTAARHEKCYGQARVKHGWRSEGADRLQSNNYTALEIKVVSKQII